MKARIMRILVQQWTAVYNILGQQYWPQNLLQILEEGLTKIKFAAMDSSVI